jgi:sortase A
VLVLAEVSLLLIGFVAVGWAGYMTAQRLLYSSWQDYRFEQTLQGEEASLTGYVRYLFEGKSERPESEQPTADVAPPPAAPAPESRKLKTNELIGRIEIPRVKVSAVVKEGADTKTLSRAVGHIPYTALPGEKGNVGVAAHRDTFFRGLRDVRHGDVIRVVTTEGVYLYEVDSMKIVWPKNVEVLDPTPDKRITLVTCFPFNYIGHAPKRFIVQGKQVGFEELSARSKPASASRSDAGL